MSMVYVYSQILATHDFARPDLRIRRSHVRIVPGAPFTLLLGPVRQPVVALSYLSLGCVWVAREEKVRLLHRRPTLLESTAEFCAQGQDAGGSDPGRVGPAPILFTKINPAMDTSLTPGGRHRNPGTGRNPAGSGSKSHKETHRASEK